MQQEFRVGPPYTFTMEDTTPNLERAEAFEPNAEAGPGRYMSAITLGPISKWMAGMLPTRETEEARLKAHLEKVEARCHAAAPPPRMPPPPPTPRHPSPPHTHTHKHARRALSRRRAPPAASAPAVRASRAAPLPSPPALHLSPVLPPALQASAQKLHMYRAQPVHDEGSHTNPARNAVHNTIKNEGPRKGSIDYVLAQYERE